MSADEILCAAAYDVAADASPEEVATTFNSLVARFESVYGQLGARVTRLGRIYNAVDTEKNVKLYPTMA